MFKIHILVSVGSVLLVIVVAIVSGNLITKLKLPAILGWLLAGMIMGPYALNLLNFEILNSEAYHNVSKFLESAIGVMFAKDLIIRNLKKYGKQIFTITLFQSIGTFLFVTLCFGTIFFFIDVPLYVAPLFGGIAMATAPAPALSIVTQFNTEGPVTSTLIPMAMLDDIIALAVFFTINSAVGSMGSAVSSSVVVTLLISIVLPIVFGVLLGFIVLPIIKMAKDKKGYLVFGMVVVTIVYFATYAVDNFVLPAPALNYMLVSMATFSTIANKVSQEAIHDLSAALSPVLGIGLMVMIVNLGAPLDYKLILGAGAFTAIYIIARAIGKYSFSYIGGTVSKAEPTVRKYLGFTLLPHSGVSLIFTGLATASLSGFDSESATLIKGTIAAAAVINELIAVVLAKKAFEWAGEIPKEKERKGIIEDDILGE